MWKWKSLYGVFVVVLGLGALLWVRPGQAKADGPGKSDTPKINGVATDSQLARRMLDRLALADFAGTIEFVYHATAGSGPRQSQITQTGRLFIGPNGRVRLDLTFVGSDYSVTCCVADGQTWMVFPRSPLVHATRFPFPVDQADDGMLGQLRMQTHQTLVWANVVVYNLFADSAQRRLESARLASDRLSIGLGAAGTDDQVGPMAVDATFMKEFDGYYPTQITFANTGNIMTLGDYSRTQHGRVMARQITQALRGSGRQVMWQITDIRSHDSTDTEFIAQRFEPPTGRSEARPQLLGQCFYDDDGKEVYKIW